jgi:hypothetical protein
MAGLICVGLPNSEHSERQQQDTVRSQRRRLKLVAAESHKPAIENPSWLFYQNNMTTTFTKLFSSIHERSIWTEPAQDTFSIIFFTGRKECSKNNHAVEKIRNINNRQKVILI